MCTFEGVKKKPICEGDQSRTALVASSCSQLPSSYPIQYVWGSCASDGLISVMMCNQSLVEVTVDTTFRTEDLYINTNEIPIVNASSEQPSKVKADITSVYEALDDVGVDDKKLAGLDSFFRTLVLSRLSITLERIVMPERQNSVSQAIRQLHGILAAQAINGELIRRPLANKLRIRDGSQPIIPAHVDYVIPRLMQGNVQTFVLIGLLAFSHFCLDYCPFVRHRVVLCQKALEASPLRQVSSQTHPCGGASQTDPNGWKMTA
ncbi:hypothetical protein NXS19_009326 [Fusarium pseudograminearum]|nr:hypothetical protein NXS19_009326 [Fusarium pseudograminearum]